MTPHYEEWYGEIDENNIYDYEIVQFYQESFKLYSAESETTYKFNIDYSLEEDFYNLGIYKVIGMSPSFEETVLNNDAQNYEISLNLTSKEITIIDLDSSDGYLNKFDLISVILNFSAGPVSTLTKIILTDQFNKTYLSKPENTFYDIISIGFQYKMTSGLTLLEADSNSLVLGSLFEPIDYIRNPLLKPSVIYNLIEDDSNIIYEADLDFDGKLDYK